MRTEVPATPVLRCLCREQSRDLKTVLQMQIVVFESQRVEVSFLSPFTVTRRFDSAASLDISGKERSSAIYLFSFTDLIGCAHCFLYIAANASTPVRLWLIHPLQTFIFSSLPSFSFPEKKNNIFVAVSSVNALRSH